jgi:peptidoglycan L-alanyl-D-glutamate endopeptidase CwlK
MPRWSKKSAERLYTCDTDLIRLFDEVLKVHNCSILDGHRDQYRQNLYYKEKKSKVEWPNSKHNKNPSRAADVIFYPYNEHSWDDREKFKFFRGIVYGIASQLGIRLNKTIEWDLGHFSLWG